MKILVVLILVLAVFGCSNSDQPIEKVVVEFRAAQLEPDSNLIKMTGEGFPEIYYVHQTAEITNIDIDSATVVMWDKKPQVKLLFNLAGKEKLATFTQKNIEKRVAIIVDGQLVAAPVVRAPLTDGVALITGDFDPAQANRIAQGIMQK